MSNFLTLELDDEQRKILLQGIQWMRSKVKLTPQDPTEEVVEARKDELYKLDSLTRILNGEEVVQETTA